MRRFATLAASVAITCTLGSHGEAAQILCTDYAPELLASGACLGIYIEGEIRKGDYQVFRSLLRKSEPHVREVTLISPGGSVAEAINIGELIRQRMLKTRTAFVGTGGVSKLISELSSPSTGIVYGCQGPECICASACFLIWSAGIERDGNALIVHRPRDVSGSFGAKSAARASQEYGKLLEYMTTYLVRMEVPSRFIDLMVKTPSNASLPLPPAEVEEDLEGFPSTIAEWLIAECGAILTQEEKRSYSTLSAAKAINGALNDQDEKYRAYLSRKFDNTDQCVHRKITRERVRLSRESPL